LNEEAKVTIHTIGYSTRTLEEFIQILKTVGINLLVDIRAAPHSKYNPQFNKEALPEYLKPYNIKYFNLPEIGGLRHPNKDSVNLAFKSGGFRGYADYMQTREFTDNLLKIIALTKNNKIILMCTEALPGRCHRILISDALTARGIRVLHIFNKDNIITHRLNEAAHIEGTKVTYPLFVKDVSQRKLINF